MAPQWRMWSEHSNSVHDGFTWTSCVRCHAIGYSSRAHHLYSKQSCWGDHCVILCKLKGYFRRISMRGWDEHYVILSMQCCVSRAQRKDDRLWDIQEIFQVYTWYFEALQRISSCTYSHSFICETWRMIGLVSFVKVSHDLLKIGEGHRIWVPPNAEG